jgi:hypothetical protein
MKTFQEFIIEARKKEKMSVDIDAERGEFERYPNSDELMKKARSSPVRKLKSSEVHKLSNTDAGEIKPGAQGRRNVRRLAKKYGRDLNRVIQQVKNKQDEPAIVGPGGKLIAGNTRAMVRRSLNRPVKALMISNDDG